MNESNNKNQKDEFTIFKFVINNNNGITIQANMYDQEIEKYSNLITKNEVNILQNLRHS